MNRTLCAVGFAALCATWTAPAAAGIADSPLPVLSAGATTFHLYSVPGVISSGGLRTYFSCTSTDTATMHVGVELFDALGGAPANDDAATSLSVIAGATVIFGTGPRLGFSIDSNLLANKPLRCRRTEHDLSARVEPWCSWEAFQSSCSKPPSRSSEASSSLGCWPSSFLPVNPGRT